MKTITTILASLLLSSAFAAEPVAYDWKVLRVLDGDTVEIEATYLPKPLKPTLKLRVSGIDTPEKNPRAKCPEEHALALQATDYTKATIRNGKQIKVTVAEWDKYGGRILGDVIVDGKRISAGLITAGLAREYHGEAKKSWCK